MMTPCPRMSGLMRTCHPQFVMEIPRSKCSQTDILLFYPSTLMSSAAQSDTASPHSRFPRLTSPHLCSMSDLIDGASTSKLSPSHFISDSHQASVFPCSLLFGHVFRHPDLARSLPSHCPGSAINLFYCPAKNVDPGIE